MINIELFKLFGTILIEDQEAIKQLKNVDKKGKETKVSLQDIADKGAKIGAAIVAGAGVAVGGLMSLASTTSNTASEIDKFSKITGFSTEGFQEWDYIMKTVGYSMEQASGDMAALAEKAMDAAAGAGEGAELFEKLGVAVTDSSGQLKSQEQIFEETIIALQGMTNETERNAVASALMSTTGEELTPLLSMNADGIEKLKNKASELGLVMSQESVTAGAEFNSKLRDAQASLTGVKDKIMLELLPKLTEMLEWFMANMPQIQEVAGNALTFISDTITFITDNSNILIPVLGGLLGAFLALKVISIINALMVAYTAFTTTATGAQLTLSAAMMANPIGLVIAAIAALIGIVIALVMNWDKVKAAAQSLWEKIKTVFTAIKDSIAEKVDSIKSKVSSVFNTIKDVMSKPFESARDKIKSVIDKIKGFLNFNWSFPKLKMPHFSISGSANPLKWLTEGVPKLNVEWYHKGGIFTQPTILGGIGVGDAYNGLGSNAEAVIPLDSMYKNIKNIISNENKEKKSGLILNIENFNNEREQDIEDLMEEIAFFMKKKGLA